MQTPTVIVSVLLILIVLLIPRKWFLMPFVMAACIIPADQRIIIMDLDFTPLRILVLFGILRILCCAPQKKINWNFFDKLVFIWIITGTVIYIIQWKTFSSAIYKSGVMFDCFGLYYIFRQNLKSWKDLFFTIELFAFFAVVSAPLIIYERITEVSLFSNFGVANPGFHHGRFRCTGPFPHSIMMGLFWANLLPLFYGCFKAGRNRPFFLTAIAAACICVLLSGSSTPIMTVAAICTFWMIYKFRSYGKEIFIGFLFLLITLHIAMKAPVWHLIARVNVFSGSTGWHRFLLIDRTIANFREWALFGCKGVEHWGIWAGDITNQFVLEGVNGGFATMLIFIFTLGYAVYISSRSSLIPQPAGNKWMCWAICIATLGHCVSFLGVSYFCQIMMLLYLQFASVSFISRIYNSQALTYKSTSRHAGPILVKIPGTNGCLKPVPGKKLARQNLPWT